PKTALLIIDMQLGNFQGQDSIRYGNRLLEKCKILIDKARVAIIPIVFIKNRGSKGDPDEPDTEGWEIHPELAPRITDQIVEKTTPDSFHKTSLKRELDSIDVSRLVIAGLQTEYCIDTTCRCASLLGYDVILASDAHSTWDSDLLSAESIINHHNNVLAGTFVSLCKTDEITFR
ncbi:MAG: cysteine hydrolase family protein, partial [Candidatus Thorarchaeota archaeon]